MNINSEVESGWDTVACPYSSQTSVKPIFLHITSHEGLKSINKLQSDKKNLPCNSLLKSRCLPNEHGDLGGFNKELFSISICLFDEHPSQRWSISSGVKLTSDSNYVKKPVLVNVDFIWLSAHQSICWTNRGHLRALPIESPVSETSFSKSRFSLVLG